MNPTGTVSYTTAIGSSSHAPGTYVLPRISGHRDVSATACPGTWLYSQLGTIRSQAQSRFAAHLPEQPKASPTTAQPEIVLEGDFNGDDRDDVLRYRPGAAPDELWYGGPTGMVRSSTNISGNGRDDIFWYRPGPASDQLWLATKQRGSFDRRAVSVNGTYTPRVVDAADDGADDIVCYAPGRAPDHLWQFERGGRYQSVPIVVTGTYEPLVGDFNGDGREDVLWLAPAMPSSYLWFGQPDGQFRSIPATA